MVLRLGCLSWRLGAWQITASAEEALITGYCIENPALSMEAPPTTSSVRQTTRTKRQGTIKVNGTYTAGYLAPKSPKWSLRCAVDEYFSSVLRGRPPPNFSNMPVVPHILQLATRSAAVISEPLTDAGFELDSSGVAGFFGGESAVSGMATVNLIPNRRWGGWYNSPGSYEIAKQYGQLANSRFWDGLFPGGKHDPARLFELDGKLGPKFVAVHSGTTLASTGHLAHLIARHARERTRDETIPGRHSNSATVTVIELPEEPDEIVQPTLPSRLSGSVFWAVIPIAVSWTCCILCALMDDWFSFAAIASGIIANGWACFVIGSGKLTFRHPTHTMVVPAGDGFLFDNRNIVVLKGPEGAVNAVTQGRFLLQYRGQQDGESELKPAHGPPQSPDVGLEMEMEMLLGDIEEERSKVRESKDRGRKEGDEKGRMRTVNTGEKDNDSELPGAWNALVEVFWERLEIFLSPTKRFIGFSSFLLTVQFLAQLLLIPQGELFGQLMFVITLAFSWAYNSYLSSLDRDDLQTTILFDILGLDEGGSIKKYQFSSWTATVVFTCLSLQPPSADKLSPHARKILDEMIPNDTEVWTLWKKAVAEKISTNSKERPKFTKPDWNQDHLNHDEKELLRELLKDAMVAGRAWEDAQSRRSSTRTAANLGQA